MSPEDIPEAAPNDTPDKKPELAKTKLPEHAELVKRLGETLNDIEGGKTLNDIEGIEIYYDNLRGLAGSQLDGVEVVNRLYVTVANYRSPLPSETRHKIVSNLKAFLENIIDDETVRSDAIRFWDEAIGEPPES